MLGSDSLRTDCWLVGRLDGVSFDGQGAFDLSTMGTGRRVI